MPRSRYRAAALCTKHSFETDGWTNEQTNRQTHAERQGQSARGGGGPGIKLRAPRGGEKSALYRVRRGVLRHEIGQFCMRKCAEKGTE